MTVRDLSQPNVPTADRLAAILQRSSAASSSARTRR